MYYNINPSLKYQLTKVWIYMSFTRADFKFRQKIPLLLKRNLSHVDLNFMISQMKKNNNSILVQIQYIKLF